MCNTHPSYSVFMISKESDFKGDTVVNILGVNRYVNPRSLLQHSHYRRRDRSKSTNNLLLMVEWKSSQKKTWVPIQLMRYVTPTDILTRDCCDALTCVGSTLPRH